MIKEPCPGCREKGGDSSGDNLARYDDGGAHCFVCGYHENGEDSKYRRKFRKEEDEVSVDNRGNLEIYYSMPCRPVHEVSLETCERYGIRVSVNEMTGEIDSVFYPYYSEDNKIVAAKVRRLSDKKFYWLGDHKKTTLFGQQTIGQGGSMVVIVEGEKDALAMTEMFKICGKNYKVISIRDGANLPKRGKELPEPDALVAANLDRLSKFDYVIIAFDNDKPGDLTARSCAELIAPVTNVKILKYPEGYKDAHEMLVGNEDNPPIPKKMYEVLANAKEFTPEAIYNGEDISLDTLMVPLETGSTIPFHGLQDKLKGLRKGELTTICAASGAGKSTLSRELAYHLVKGGHSVANIFLEETMEKTAQAYIALDNNIPLARLRAQPDSISREQYEESYAELIANGRNYFFKHFGSLDSDLLLNKMRYFAKAKGVDYIFLDHLSMVVSASDEGNDERKLLDKICTKLAAFCTETGVGVIMVVHLRKTGNQQQSASQGGMITLDDLRGSGGIAQLSFNVIAVLRDTTSQDDAKMNIVQPWVLKNREWGTTGPAGKLLYNTMTGRLENLPDF